jgi:hypothetical protein
MYWKESYYFSTIINKLMRWRRYKKLNECFHIGECQEVRSPMVIDSNRIIKIEKVLKHFNKRWKECYGHGYLFTIDVCMASFKGRIRFKQYMKLKKKKWGVKFFAKVNSLNGYVYSVIPYTGKTFIYDKDRARAICNRNIDQRGADY